jgi:hypothetical protein
MRKLGREVSTGNGDGDPGSPRTIEVCLSSISKRELLLQALVHAPEAGDLICCGLETCLKSPTFRLQKGDVRPQFELSLLPPFDLTDLTGPTHPWPHKEDLVQSHAR